MTQPASGATMPHLFTHMPAHRVGALFSLYFLALAMSIGLLFIPTYLLAGYMLGWNVGWSIKGFGAIIPMYLACVSIIYGLRFVILLVMLGVNMWGDYRRPFPVPEQWPFVSIIMPAFNEEVLISFALESYCVQDYPRFEVLVIDDGSKDQTFERAKQFEGSYSWGDIRVIKKPNGGKWTALNLGFKLASGEILLSVDADGAIDGGALKQMVAHMLSNPRIGAVAGYTRVMNRTNLLTYCQSLEFVMWSGVLRYPQSLTGSVLCIPGPLGLFRREALEEVHQKFGKLSGELAPGIHEGPFEQDTFAEDFDATIALLQLGWRVEYDPLAGCDTDTPADVFTFMNQRYRWARGSMQVIFKYCRRMREYRVTNHSRLFGWLMSTYIFDIALYSLGMIAQAIIFVMALTGTQGALTTLLAFLFYQFVFRLVIASITIAMHRDTFAPILAVPFLDLYGSFLLGFAFLISVLDEVFRLRMNW